MKKAAVFIFILMVTVPLVSHADNLFNEMDQTLRYNDELALFARRHPDRGGGGEQTLISGEIESGGAGGPLLKFSGVSDTFCVFIFSFPD